MQKPGKHHRACTKQYSDALLSADPDSADGSNAVGMAPEELKEVRRNIALYRKRFSDWEERDRVGVEPLRPYIERIESIDSMEEMTAYLCGEGSGSSTGLLPLKLSETMPLFDHEGYAVLAAPKDTILSPENTGRLRYERVVRAVLDKLDIRGKQQNAIIERGFRTELSIQENTRDREDNKSLRRIYTREEAETFAGAFPFGRVLSARKLDEADRFMIPQVQYLKWLGTYYCEKNLEDLKCYYICHTAYDMARYLDWDLSELPTT